MNNNLDNLDDSYPIFFPKYLFINNKQNINKQNINRENKQFNSNIQNNQFWKFKLK